MFRRKTTGLKPVHPGIIKRAEQELGHTIPEKFTLNGKDFRKYLAKQLGSGSDIQSEKLAYQIQKDTSNLVITK